MDGPTSFAPHKVHKSFFVQSALKHDHEPKLKLFNAAGSTGLVSSPTFMCFNRVGWSCGGYITSAQIIKKCKQVVE